MTHKKTAYILLSAAAVLIAVSAVIAVGTAFARYRTTSSVALTMNNVYSKNGVWLWASYNENYVQTDEGEEAQPKYNALQNWTSINDETKTYTLGFLLTNEGNSGNPAGFNQNVILEVFVTEGVADPSKLTVTLSTNNGTYTATATKVAEGSTVYNAYGAGWIYRFTSDGQPLTWYLQGGRTVAIPMTLIVAGQSVEPASLSLIATGTPAD